MFEILGWDSLEDRRLFFQASMFYKILVGHVGISFPLEVHEIKRVSRLPNSRPFQQIGVLNNVDKYSFLSKDDFHMEQPTHLF